MNTVLESIKNLKKYSQPWPHYEIRNIFDANICSWITGFNYPTKQEILTRKKNWFLSDKSRSVGIIGIRQYVMELKQRYADARRVVWHKKTHPCEFIFGTDFLQQHIQAKRIVDMFLAPEVISLLESFEGVKLRESLLRVMLIKDVTGYKIPVHPDTDKKLFTLQCFFKTDVNKGCDLGTQICDEEGIIVKRTIYEENAGTFFFPRQQKTENYIPTLHSFVDTPIQDYRISVMVNYCKREEVTRDDVGNKLGYLIPVRI